MKICILIFFTFQYLNYYTSGLLPPIFQWQFMDFAWEGEQRKDALSSGDYIPENNMPTGLVRWRDKLFITIPRWKKGVPASLNYVKVNGDRHQPLIPYPSWRDAFVSNGADTVSTNSTVVCTFRIHVDRCDRLWVVDNGVTDMYAEEVQQITPPALLVFDLKRDVLKYKYEFPDDVLKDASVLTNIVVDIVDKDCGNAFAYIPDMGSGALLVYSLRSNEAWRVESSQFHHDPEATVYKIGGIEFFWNDGISSVALSNMKPDGHRDLYCHPTSSTKLLRISTKLLRQKDIDPETIENGVQIVGDRGPSSQATACDYDQNTNVLFYTQLSKNGLGCWNSERKLTQENTPLLISDCNMLEFPNDVKVDVEGNMWILSDRQSRFLYGKMDFGQVNFRVLTAPASSLIRGSRCHISTMERAVSYIIPMD